jgi:hypothetical protein
MREFARSDDAQVPCVGSEWRAASIHARPLLAPSYRSGASGEGSKGADMTRLQDRPQTPAICAFETFEATSRIDVKRTQPIATVDVEKGGSCHSRKGLSNALHRRGQIGTGRVGYWLRSDEFGKQRAGVPDIARGLAALDRGQDRLQ